MPRVTLSTQYRALVALQEEKRELFKTCERLGNMQAEVLRNAQFEVKRLSRKIEGTILLIAGLEENIAKLGG